MYTISVQSADQQSKLTVQMFLCYKCEYKTSTSFCLDKHNQSFHRDGKYIGIKTLYGIRQSLQEVMKYPCASCDYEATRKSHLTRHEGKKYPCVTCDYQATTRNKLTTHNKWRHEGKTFPCDSCDYQAAIRQN